MAVRFYAGCVLRTDRGEALGTLAVYGAAARALSPAQRASLLLLAEQAVARAELRSQVTELALLGGARPAPLPAPSDAGPDRALLDSAPVAIYSTDKAGNLAYSNPEYRRMFGLTIGHSPDAWAQIVHPTIACPWNSMGGVLPAARPQSICLSHPSR